MGQAGPELLAQAVAGDQRALTRLLQEHAAELSRAIGGRIPRRWRSVLSVEDVLQQAFADAFLGIKRFASRNERAFSRWLHVIARRNLSNALSMLEADKRGGDRRRATHEGGTGSMADLLDMISAAGTTPSRGLRRRESQKALARAVRQLPEMYRHVIRLYDYSGRPVEEIAKELGRSTGAIYMIRARALRRLRIELGAASQYLTDN